MINSYLEEKNIQSVRDIQSEIHDYYVADESKYSEDYHIKKVDPQKVCLPKGMTKMSSLNLKKGGI